MSTLPIRIVPRIWPPLLAFGLVAVLLLVMVGVDMVVSRGVAGRTDAIIANALRSVELVDDLREQANLLASLALSPTQTQAVLANIRRDGVEYEPLATYRGEYAEWKRLQRLLAELEVGAARGDSALVHATSQSVSKSISGLVFINREAAEASAFTIDRLHWHALLIDAGVGGVMLVLVAAVALGAVASLRRQAELVGRWVEANEQRYRELDAFAGRAAHDLRVPLNPIRGYADLMMQGNEPPEEVKTMATRIRTAVDRMGRIIDDMLELSRAGRPRPGVSQLDTVGAEVIADFALELAGAEVELALPSLHVACSPTALAQILRNLVANSIKFRSRTTPLALRISGRADGGKHVELVVADNGVGMDNESAAHAFDPYYRGGRTDLEVPGHGLGLAIVERLVMAHGGVAQLDSQPDAGTRITINLPLA